MLPGRSRPWTQADRRVPRAAPARPSIDRAATPLRVRVSAFGRPDRARMDRNDRRDVRYALETAGLSRSAVVIALETSTNRANRRVITQIASGQPSCVPSLAATLRGCPVFCAIDEE